MVSQERESRRRILVIDDDEVMRELLFALLEVQGYEVTAAASGEEALELLQASAPPLLLLTDLQMPGLEGEALTSALREAAPTGATLVGMSGRQPSEALLHSLDAFLPKPFSAVQLEEAFLAARDARSPLPLPEGQKGATVTGSPLSPASTPTSPAAGEAVLDEAIFASLARSFRPEQLRELYGMTLDDVRERHARMQQDAAAGDLPAVQREAHAVKGACGMVGARELQFLAAAVEGQIDGGTTLNTSAIADFPAACARLRRMLDAKLQQ